MMIKANDDDCEEWDYIGLVFDTNQNGYIDIHDVPIALYANNMTQPSVLWEGGFLEFAECIPTRGPHTVTFNTQSGYTFIACFPQFLLEKGEIYQGNPTIFLKRGGNNPLHVCFYDDDVAKVFVRFLFYLPEE